MQLGMSKTACLKERRSFLIHEMAFAVATRTAVVAPAGWKQPGRIWVVVSNSAISPVKRSARSQVMVSVIRRRGPS